MSDVRVIRLRDAGPLHDALLSACPPNADGVVSVGVLADWLDVTTAAVYKWISEGKVPPARVPELLRLQRQHFGEVRVGEATLNPLFG